MLHQMELKKRDSIIETKTLDWFIKEQCGLSLDGAEVCVSCDLCHCTLHWHHHTSTTHFCCVDVRGGSMHD